MSFQFDENQQNTKSKEYEISAETDIKPYINVQSVLLNIFFSMAAVVKAISHAKPTSTRKLDSFFQLHLKLTLLQKKRFKKC